MSVAGFGAINLDRIYKAERIAKEGQDESFCQFADDVPGGSAANTIIGLARLGIETGYFGKIGRDAEGQVSLHAFQTEGVGIDGILLSDRRSGLCQIFVDPKGRRAIYIDPGVNDEISPNEIDLDYLNRFDTIHMTSFVCKNSDMSLLAQKKAAKRADADISFDPGFLYAKRGFGEMKDIIKNSKVVMPNENEIRLLTGADDYAEGADMLLSEGVKIVAVKLGENGCYITDGEKQLTVPAYKVNVVDTTGAGDAWNTGFLYGLERGKSLKDCGILGNRVAAYSIQKIGARAGLPTEKMLWATF